MAEIFLSYARSTAARAQQVAEALRALGYGVWRDDELPAHRPYAEVIEERLNAAKAVVVLWSPDAVRSQWVRSEANHARENGKLVQLALEPMQPPMPFDQIQCADLVGWTGDTNAPGWRKVVASVSDLAGAANAVAAPAADASPSPPDKPSIAVMPFANLSDDPSQDYFADGMTEEIVATLSRFKSIFVISSGSTMTLKGKAVTPQDIARLLGVRYVLEGSLRKAGDRVRIAVKLTDANSGAQVWADRYDDTLEDVFALQDKVALSVAGVIEPAVLRAEIQRASTRPTQSVNAYELFLRALPGGASWTKSGLYQALDLLNRAIVLDPNFARAIAFAAWCESELWQSGLDRTAERRSRAIELTHRALQLAEDDPEVLFRAALVLGNQLLEDLDSAIVLADRALALNPGLAIAWSASGWQRLTAGQPDLAAEQFQTMERLDPLAHRSNYLLGMGVARFGQKRFSEAADLLRQARHLRPDSPNECIFLAACYGHLGQRDAGREAVARWEALTDTSVHDPVNWFANHSIIMPAIAIIEGTAPPDARAPV